MSESKKIDEKYTCVCDGGEMRQVLGGPYYKYTQNLKVNMGVKCKVILNERTMKDPFSSEVRGSIKWLPNDYEFPVSVWTYNEKTILLDWYKKPLSTIIMNNKNIYKTYLTQFKSLWKEKGVKYQELYSKLTR